MRLLVRKTRSASSHKHREELWRRIASAALCLVLLGTNAAEAMALETPATESAVPKEEIVTTAQSAATLAPTGTPAPEETPAPTGTPAPEETPAPMGTPAPEETPAPTGTPAPEETPAPMGTPAPEETPAPTAEPEEKVYTLRLTHIFWFRQSGEDTSLELSQTLTLTGADFVDGLCDLNRFAESGELLTVTEAESLSVDSFDGNQEGSARIVYQVKAGWKLVRKDTMNMGFKLRGVFQGVLDGYEFIPADVVRVRMSYKYSNTGGLAGIDAASPETVEAIPEKQADGSYKLTWALPTVDGFRIVLSPKVLNDYVVNPPTGSESPEELAQRLENGDFNVDIDNHIIYYYQESGSGDHTQHPVYKNRYSTEYNGAWNDARKLTVPGDTGYSAEAVCGGQDAAHPAGAEDHGANALVDPKLEVALTEAQLTQILKDGTELDITVYYRRNATWYTVNHWVQEKYSGLGADEIAALPADQKKTVDGTNYVLVDQDRVQGRVGAATNAKVRTSGIYRYVSPVSFAQKQITGQDTAVDIFYKIPAVYTVIFDTDYTYIPRQQVESEQDVNFTGIPEPTRTGYTFAGWRYLREGAVPNPDGSYADSEYIGVAEEAGQYKLTLERDVVTNAKLIDDGGVLALHLYPKWEPDMTQVRVILWTEDLTGTDDVQALVSGGNPSFYSTKYADYGEAPQTHEPQLGTSDPHYSNAGSFTVEMATDASLLAADQTALLDTIQTQVTEKFKETMGNAEGVELDQFYSQAAFEIVHEEEGGTNYGATTASADGKTVIYVYFTRNIYTLQFHYYGTVNGNAYSVANKTNGYSYANNIEDIFTDNNFNFAANPSGSYGSNSWSQTTAASDDQMPVPETITICAKYGADLREVWPVAQPTEHITVVGSSNIAKMVSWSATEGKYRDDANTPGSTHHQEATIMGVYAAMGSEIIAQPDHPDRTHHLVAFWAVRADAAISYYRYNHCYEVPALDVAGMQKVSIYNDDTDNVRNFLYLVPTDNEAIVQYDFNDLMPVSYDEGTGMITYDDPNGTFYAVRVYNGRCYALARRVMTPSTNSIEKQNPSARLHMTRANGNADHSTQYQDNQGGWQSNFWFNDRDNPYDLYFYYNRDQYTITYMAPSNNSSTADTEVTLGTVTLPYGAMVTEEKYGFKLDYLDTSDQTENGTAKYGWTPAGTGVSVCPDRAKNGTAVWKFRGWALGPAGVNMQWVVNEDTQTEAQTGDDFAIGSNLRLYAIWEAPTYTVTFHLNGGTVNGDVKDIEEEIPANTRYSASGVIPRPIRSGYTLDGWYDAEADGSITQSETKFDFDQTIAENKHVAAKWTPISTETFDYTVYYVTKSPLDADQGKETVLIDADGNIGAGETYTVLAKVAKTNQMFIENSSLNFPAMAQNGYVPRETNQILTMNQPGDTYNVIFHYDPITPGKYAVNFILAGTEGTDAPSLIKELVVEADQTVVTPQSAAAKALKNLGYALVNKDGDGYTTISEAKDLQWIDEKGNSQPIGTLKGNAIPATVTYLVQLIPYTITYQNAAGSPAAAGAALTAVTAAANTPVQNAMAGKNPTLYTSGDSFTAVNPERVYENGKVYEFSHWSLGENTKEDDGNQTFNPLAVERGTVGDLTFIANWKEATAAGSLTVSKTVAGDAGETDRAFTFTVTLGDTNVSGTFGDMTFANGVASFTLKHGESKTATGLPVGTTYRVTEAEAGKDGYTTVSNNARGIIPEAGITAVFTNTRNSIPVNPWNPDEPYHSVRTGDESRLTLWLAFMGVSTAGLSAVLAEAVRRNKTKRRGE